MSRWWVRSREAHWRELQQQGKRPGYYLNYKGINHWFAETIGDARARLTSICDRVLDEDQPYYEVHCSLGVDVHGNPAWTNIDHSDQVCV